MMSGSKGFILITTLILMLVLSCISLSMLVQTQLSQKLAGSATLAFQLKQQTQSKHLQELKQLQQSAAESDRYSIGPCPAHYAAWTELTFRCEWYQVQTSQRHAQHQHTVTSFLVRQSLSEGGGDGVL